MFKHFKCSDVRIVTSVLHCLSCIIEFLCILWLRQCGSSLAEDENPLAGAVSLNELATRLRQFTFTSGNSQMHSNGRFQTKREFGAVNLVNALALNLMCILYWLKCRRLESVERRRDKLLRWNTLHAPGKQHSSAFIVVR